MFCPNCSAPNEDHQHFCRSCGLKLDAIAAEIAEQKPSAEFAEFLKRKKFFENLGKLSGAIAAFVGFLLILSIAAYYKLILLGPEILIGSALGAVVLFGLLSAFFFAYPKFFMKFDKLRAKPETSPVTNELSAPTDRLLDESRFEPASVTEDETE